jgi:hypothetical protein
VQQPLHLNEDRDAARERLDTAAVDAEVAAQLAGVERAGEVKRLCQLGGAEPRADESPGRAGGAADRERRVDRRRLDVGERRDRLLARIADRRGTRGESDGAEIDRVDPPRLVARRPDGDLGRCTADVADGDRRGEPDVRGRNGAAVREPALLLDLQHARRLDGRDELVAVRRLPAGRGEEDVDIVDAVLCGERAQLLHGLGRGADAGGRHDAVLLDLGAEREPDAAGIDRLDAVAPDVGHEELGRIRSDVEDADAHGHRS